MLGVTRQSQESLTATQLGTRWNGAAPSCTAKGARRRVQNCDPAVGSWLRDLCVELGELWNWCKTVLNVQFVLRGRVIRPEGICDSS